VGNQAAHTTGWKGKIARTEKGKERKKEKGKFLNQKKDKQVKPREKRGMSLIRTRC